MQFRSKFSFLLLSAAAILFFSSCSKTNKEGRYIPSNAAFVIHINGKSLNEKLPWDEIKQGELFRQVYADSTTPPIIKSVLDNPENTGIDAKNDILIFVVNDSAGGYVAVEGTIKDEAKFKQFHITANKTPATETEKDGIHFLANDKMTVSWKNEKFVFVMDAPGLNSNMKWNKAKMSLDTMIYEPTIKKDLNAYATQVFALKEDKSLGKEEKFTDLMKAAGDIHFWVNVESLGIGKTDMPGMAALSMIDLKKLYEGSRMAGSINFDNGKINADFTSYSGKEMAELTKKYSGDKINTDMVKRIPSKNVAGVVAINFKPEVIREYLKMLGMEGFANMGAGMLGLNVDDFIKATKGDILIAATDLVKDSSGKPNASMLFSASVGDKASFTKLVDAGKKLGKEKFMGEDGPSIFYNMSENYFTMGNKKADVDKYIATADNNNFDFLDKLAGNSSGGYLNLQYILKAFTVDQQKDSLAYIVYDASLKMWDNVYFSGTGFKNGGSTSHFEINLLDKNTNSLKQLNKYMNVLGAAHKLHGEKQKNMTWEDKTSTNTTQTVTTH